nr:hypothetical protein [Mediterraneibacter gnavus]
MLEQIDQIIKVIDGAVWGLPLIILILLQDFFSQPGWVFYK